MEIEQEVSDVAPTSVAGASDITTNLRSIRTTVLVEDGQTLVLGGLLDDSHSETAEKVPVLGDIPILGNLFRFRTSTQEKRNLMVFLHPTILRDIETADYYSRTKYDDHRNAQIQFMGGGFDHAGDKPVPLLPELRLYYQGQPVTNPRALNTIVPATSSIEQEGLQLSDENTSAEGLAPIEENSLTNDNRLVGPFDKEEK